MSDIIDSIEEDLLLNGQASVSDRYFEHKYCLKIAGIEDAINQRVSFHTNKICMLSLADNHPIMKDSKTIKRIDFAIDEKIDRGKNNASGKSKRGAQKLNPDSIVCYLETDDGRYPIYSCVKGKLIEINESLLDNPQLLMERPTSEGYIALILPVLNMHTFFKENMLSKDDYLLNAVNK